LDYRLTHALNHLLVLHDGVADPFEAYAPVSQVLFAAALVLLFVPGAPVRARRAGAAGGIAVALALMVGKVLSSMVDRPRPFVAHPGGVHSLVAHAHDAGFPSDHATAAFAIAFGVWTRWRAGGAVLLVLALLIAVDRVGMGLHYPADVVAGAVLGIGAGALTLLGPMRRRLDALADGVGERVDSVWA
jgi:undecaprenyl-diphosphatase